MTPESLDLPAWLDVLQEPLWIEDSCGEILYGNRAFRLMPCRHIGRSPQERFWNDIPRKSGSSAGRDGFGYTEKTFSTELFIDERWYRLVTACMSDVPAGESGWICQLHDITDLKEKEYLLKDVIIECGGPAGQACKEVGDGC